jgi:hypothetical protein
MCVFVIYVLVGGREVNVTGSNVASSDNGECIDLDVPFLLCTVKCDSVLSIGATASNRFAGRDSCTASFSCTCSSSPA